MAMKNIACTNLAQAYSGVNWDYNTYGVAYAGYANASVYGVTILRFDVPKFTGIAEDLMLGIYASIGVGATAQLRWALCSSDENRNAYQNTTGPVTDPNQLDSGTVTFAGMDNSVAKREAMIRTSKVRGGETYYLIMWASGQTGISVKSVVGAYGNHSVVLGYNQGIIRVKLGGAQKPCMVFVKTGGKVRQAIPYVKTASGVKPGG